MSKNAPPVIYPVGFFRLGLLFAITLAVTSALTVGYAVWSGRWPLDEPFFQGLMLLALVLWSAGSVSLAKAWRHPVAGHLRWSGQAWYWSAKLEHEADAVPTVALPVHVELVWDAQDFVLLGILPLGPLVETPCERWIWLAKSREPSRWTLLRCALYAVPARMVSSVN